MKKYQIIYADPPWNYKVYSKKGLGRSAESHYPVSYTHLDVYKRQVTALAAVLSRSSMTVKRSLNELETAGLIMRVRQGVGEPNRIYVLIPGKEDAAPVSYTHLDVYKRQH